MGDGAREHGGLLGLVTAGVLRQQHRIAMAGEMVPPALEVHGGIPQPVGDEHQANGMLPLRQQSDAAQGVLAMGHRKPQLAAPHCVAARQVQIRIGSHSGLFREQGLGRCLLALQPIEREQGALQIDGGPLAGHGPQQGKQRHRPLPLTEAQGKGELLPAQIGGQTIDADQSCGGQEGFPQQWRAHGALQPLGHAGGSWIGWLNSRSTFGPITPSLARSSSARSLWPASRSPALLSSSSRTTRLAPIRGKRSSSSSRATAGSAPSSNGAAASRLPARTGSWVRRGPRRKRSIGLEKNKRTSATVTISAGHLMKVYEARFHQAAGRQSWRPKDERSMAHGSCSASGVRGSGAVDFQWTSAMVIHIIVRNHLPKMLPEMTVAR